MRESFTHEEFIKRVSEKNSRIRVIGEYKGAKEKVEVECSICGYRWSTFASSFLQGSGCRVCAYKKMSESRKITHEQFVERVSVISPNITVLGKYTLGKEKIEVQCKIDGNIWYPRASKLLEGKGCPKCKISNIKKILSKTHEEFVEEVMKRNQYIVILGEYQGSNEKIKVQCKIDGTIWEPRASKLLQGQSCPTCARRETTKLNTKTHEKFVKELFNINPNITPIGKYTRGCDKILFRCNVCKNEWMITPSNVLRGESCPSCNFSKGELKIEKYLKENKIIFEAQKSFNGLVGLKNGLLSYDFYLPKENILIEYQGKFHDGSIPRSYQTEKMFEKQKEHDRRKREYAKSHGIKLLEIWYWDINNIDNILQEKLKIA